MEFSRKVLSGAHNLLDLAPHKYSPRVENYHSMTNRIPQWLSGKESTCDEEPLRRWFILRVRKIPWRRAWQPTPEFLHGESHGQRSLVGYSPWGCKASDMTEVMEHWHIQYLKLKQLGKEQKQKGHSECLCFLLPFFPKRR